MPSHEVHRLIKKMLFGESDAKVDRLIDYPVRFLGFKHRILFHDKETLRLLYLLYGEKGLRDGVLHLFLDNHIRINSDLHRILKEIAKRKL